MAVGIWPDRTPGTEHGPCLVICQHKDCARLRDPNFAYPPCCECEVVMKAGDEFFLEGNAADGKVVHAQHSYDRADAEEKARHKCDQECGETESCPFQEESYPYLKPECELIGTDGNVFAIIGKVNATLKRVGQHAKSMEFSDKAMKAGSYDEVLRLLQDYVEVS